MISVTEGYGETAVQRLFQVEYTKTLQIVLRSGYVEQTTDNDKFIRKEEEMVANK